MIRALGTALAAAVTWDALSAPLSAQDITGRFRNPRAATYWAIVPGGGYLYTGEYDRGVVLLGGSVALIAAGAHASRRRCDLRVDIDPDTQEPVSVQTCERQRSWMALGAVGAAGLWFVGLLDASDSARRANFRNGWSLGPGTGAPRVAMQLFPDAMAAATLTVRIPVR